MNIASNLHYKAALIGLASLLPIGHAHAATTVIQANAKIVKSLTLTAKQSLDFGTITLSGTPGTITVGVSMAGALSCPTGATCAGAARPALLNVQGSNAQIVRITVANANLVNAADGSSIPFTPEAPATILLTNSGAPGKDFNVGGSIAVPQTADGTYSGNVEVTVEYQ